MSIRWLLVGALLGPALAYAGPENACNIKKCVSGTVVKTYATKTDSFYACPTPELAEYTNAVLGLASLSIMIGGHPPDISPVTGEPESQGQTRAIMDRLRKDAGVSTFDQGVARCKPGRHGERRTVVNEGKDRGVLWVMDASGKSSYWMPKVHADYVGPPR